MEQESHYKKFVETINKEEFNSFFSNCQPEEWFSSRELKKFSSPGNAGSLAGRYLIKKTICDFLDEHQNMQEIEILNNDFGKPEVILGEKFLLTSKRAGVKNIQCSISHSRNFITGMTIFCL
jgi:phosphopantetheinyl transferase (holo-ACP synthase)